MNIQEVTSPKGITAWLVEDYSVPIVTIRFVFDGGSTQDPPGKDGLVNLMTGLFDEGAVRRSRQRGLPDKARRRRRGNGF